MFTEDQKSLIKKVVADGNKNRVLSLRNNTIESSKKLVNYYLEDNRRKQYKTEYFDTLEEINFLNDILGLNTNDLKIYQMADIR